MDKSDCDGTGDMISAPENNQVSRQQSKKYLSLLFSYKLCLQAIENLQYTKKVESSTNLLILKFIAHLKYHIITIENKPTYGHAKYLKPK